MLFSATQTTKVQDLARISLRPGPLLIDVDKEEATSTVSTLSQGYVVCPSDRRFLLLFTFLKKNSKKKIIVFFSSCNSVKYHGELLNYIDVPVLDLHVSSLLRSSLNVWLTEGQPRANKNNKNAPIPSSSSSTQNPVSCSAPTLLLVDLISPVWTGSSNTTPRTTQGTIYIVSDVLREPGKSGRVLCSCWRASWGSCGILKTQKSL
jgi:hypothetical protein